MKSKLFENLRNVQRRENDDLLLPDNTKAETEAPSLPSKLDGQPGGGGTAIYGPYRYVPL